MDDPSSKLGPSTVKPRPPGKIERMQCYTELTPPTAVTHAICFPFLGPGISTLVIARLTLLQVYTFKTIQEEQDTDIQDASATAQNGRVPDRRVLDNDDLELSFLGVDAPVQRSERLNLTKLVLVAEYPLWGMVTALARIKIQHSKTGGEALLVATRDAKMTLIQWDPERNGISTRSLHYYEQEELQRNPFAPELHRGVTYLTVDPRSQCAAFMFGGTNLALLPFYQAGDDMATDGDHDPALDGDKMDIAPAQPANGDVSEDDLPYKPSFVLPVSALDPYLVHPIHVAFLHEYREPTLGVLACTTSTSTARLSQKRDVVIYKVFTLDLDERASTLILSVEGLPYDITRVIPLPPPVGGALLVGTNELVHVDQAGRNHAVAVNVFAQDSSSFSMADQADLGLKLEGCTIEQMGPNNSDLLMVLNTGELAIVEFALDGRTVSGIGVRRVASENGGLIVKASASCAAMLGRGKVFLGSEDGDSIVLGCSRPSNQQRRRSRAVEEDTLDDGSDDEMDEDDDDLYAGADASAMQGTSATSPDGAVKISTNDYIFRVHDSLSSIAPINDVTFGSPKDPSGASYAASDGLQLVLATGRGRAGAVTILRRELDPDVVGKMDIPDAQGAWSVRAKRPVAKKLASQPPSKATSQLNQDYGADQEYDRMMIVSKTDKEGAELSVIYAVTSTGLEEMTGTEFDPAAGGTIEVGVMCNDTRVIQVLRSEVRSYDGGMCCFLTLHCIPSIFLLVAAICLLLLLFALSNLLGLRWTIWGKGVCFPFVDSQASWVGFKDNNTCLFVGLGRRSTRASMYLFQPWTTVSTPIMSFKSNEAQYPRFLVHHRCLTRSSHGGWVSMVWTKLIYVMPRSWPSPDISHVRRKYRQRTKDPDRQLRRSVSGSHSGRS